jgi:hypothetical protein
MTGLGRKTPCDAIRMAVETGLGHCRGKPARRETRSGSGQEAIHRLWWGVGQSGTDRRSKRNPSSTASRSMRHCSA